MTTTVLVTGGAGFVGAYVSRALLAKGMRVVVFDTQPNGNVLDMLLPAATANDAGRVIREAGEITDGWRLLGICRDHAVQFAVHLASPLTMDVVANPFTGIRDICTGTATLFAVAKTAGLKRVVWASSVAAFGPKSAYPAGPLPDSAWHHPANLYGSAKSLCENLAIRAHEKEGLDVLGLRLSVVYGAGRLRGYMSYPSHLMRQAASGQAVHAAFGRQRLHWQYVDEVAAMVTTTLLAERSGGGRTYNAVGDSRAWREAAEAIRAARPGLPITIGEEYDPALADTVEDYDASGLARDYGYTLNWPLERGVRDTLDTYVAMSNTAKLGSLG